MLLCPSCLLMCLWACRYGRGPWEEMEATTAPYGHRQPAYSTGGFGQAASSEESQLQMIQVCPPAVAMAQHLRLPGSWLSDD